MNPRIEKTIVLIGNTNEAEEFINDCSEDMQIKPVSMYAHTTDSTMTMLTNIDFDFYCYHPKENNRARDYHSNMISQADAVIYLSDPTSKYKDMIEELRHQNKRCIGIDYTRFEPGALSCMEKINFLQSLIDKDYDKKLPFIITAVFKHSLFSPLPKELVANEIINSYLTIAASNKPILPATPSPNEAEKRCKPY